MAETLPSEAGAPRVAKEYRLQQGIPVGRPTKSVDIPWWRGILQ